MIKSKGRDCLNGQVLDYYAEYQQKKNQEKGVHVPLHVPLSSSGQNHTRDQT